MKKIHADVADGAENRWKILSYEWHQWHKKGNALTAENTKKARRTQREFNERMEMMSE